MATHAYIIETEIGMFTSRLLVQETEDAIDAELKVNDGKLQEENLEYWNSLLGNIVSLRDRLNTLAARLDHEVNGVGDGPKER